MNHLLTKGLDKFNLNSVLDSRLLLENSESVIYFLDHKTKQYDYMNSEIVTLTGYTLEEINELGFKSIVEKVIQSKQFLEERKNGSDEHIHIDFTAKYLIKTKNGEKKWVEDTAFTRVGKDGEKESCIGVLRNVSTLHSLFDELRDEKVKLNRILDLAEVIFLVIDKNYTVKFINEKGCRLLGYNKSEIIGKNWIKDFLSAHNRPEEISALEKCVEVEQGNQMQQETIVLTRNEEEKIIVWHYASLKDEFENGKLIVASGRDITEENKSKKIQHVISEILQAANTEIILEDFFKYIHQAITTLMPAVNFYIALYDKESQMISFPYFVDQFDEVAPPKKFGKGLTEYIIRTGKSALVNMELDKKLVLAGETELIGTPTAIWLGIPLKIQDNTIGVIAVQDYEDEKKYGETEKEILEVVSFAISRAIERRVVEQERDKLIKELKEINDSKDRLFSLISHDLRSPFNSLLGFSEILTTEYETLTEEEIKEYLNVIYESSKNLFSMTNNLLQFSRFQMGRFEFNPVKINVGRLILSNLNILKGSFVKKQLNLTTDVDTDFEVFADEDMLNSIMQNLISNAIKFTPRGGDIKISAKVINFFDERDQIEICVEDSGIGIPPEELVRIFKDHIHSTPGTEKEYGTGLGLLLVKEFVEINKGRIKVTSRVNKGSSFIFTLPAIS